MSKYKYLSDNIILSFQLPDKYTSSTVPYAVYLTPDHYNPIYVGTIFCTGGMQQLHLNDIIESVSDDFGWFRTQSQNTNQTGVLMNFRIDFDNSITYYLHDVLNAYRIPNTAKEDVFTDDSGEIKLMSEYGNGMRPRIPAYIAEDSDFFLSTNINVYADDASQKYGVAIYGKTTSNPETTCFLNFKTYDINGIIEQPVIKGDVLQHIAQYADNDNNTELYLGIGKVTNGVYDKSQTFNKLCDIDKCPADFYLCWLNRYGVYQCQPFHKKWEMTENVTTSNRATIYNETVPYHKTTQFNWVLNSDWLSYKEHDEFESLLTSKYVYLYNSQTQEGHYVNVTDSDWTFRNAKNTKRPFNLTINVSKSTKTNIVL